MKNLLLLIIALICINSLTFASKSVDTSFMASGKKHLLFYALPNNFDAAKKYPLVVGLHYCGGTAKHYRDGLAKMADSLNLIVVCPDNSSSQIPDNQLDIVTAAADSARKMYSIDADSMYLTGMSCNGEFILRQGLKKFYPFRAIFPWVPYVTTSNFAAYKLDSDIPVVLAVGTSDDNFQILMSMHDSLNAKSSNKNLVLAAGIGHTQDFDGFANTMIQCLRYINSPKTITISKVSDIKMLNSDAGVDVELDVTTTGSKALDVKIIVGNTAPLQKVEADYSSTTNKIKFKIAPAAGKNGKSKIVVEVSEKGGNAIAQSVFNVKVDKDVTSVNQNSKESDLIISPNPATRFINLKSSKNILSYKIFDTAGKEVLQSVASGKEISINTSLLAKGIYIIKTSNGNSFNSSKFVIE